MITDLHSHTNVSACGHDDVKTLIETAVKNGVYALGICDHHYGIGLDKLGYFNNLTKMQKLYQDKIKIIRGIEIATVERLRLDDGDDVSFFDYCLVEHIDYPDTVAKDFINYAKNLKTKVGIAHTDLFKYIKEKGFDDEKYLTDLKAAGIFWELNVCYDSIHRFREHAYVKEFMNSKEQQALVKKVGLEVSIGLDCHLAAEYDGARVKAACEFLEINGIKTPKF